MISSTDFLILKTNLLKLMKPLRIWPKMRRWKQKTIILIFIKVNQVLTLQLVKGIDVEGVVVWFPTIADFDAELLESVVEDMEGNKVTLKEVVAGQVTMLLFLRHFGW